jgi:hypothetical protein
MATDHPWTPDRLIPWDPERDGKDSERGDDDLDDEEVNPEDSPLGLGVVELTPEEMAARAARIWRCSTCKELVQATDWRLPAACWHCGANGFELVTDMPPPDSDGG